MEENRVTATKSDWDTENMPAKCKHYKLERIFSREEIQNLRYGHIPMDMEDRWFWYMEGDTLYAYRSWSGICIFIIEFNETTGIHNVTVNRDKKQYECTDIKADMDMIDGLLDMWAR